MFAFPFIRLKAISIAFLFLFARVQGRLTISMKPHPNIRKMIKWGGAAVTVLMVVVWIGSAWRAVWYLSKTHNLVAWVGQISIAPRGPAQASLAEGFRSNPYISAPQALRWGFDWATNSQGTAVTVPVWFLGMIALIPTIIAWRLDILARRRARGGANLCPKCNYDRAGIGAGVVCPECGSAAT